MKQNKSNVIQGLIAILVIALIYNGIQFVYYSMTMDYCDCQKYSSDAIIYSVSGSDGGGSFNDSAITFCADKIIDIMDFDMDSDKLSMSYIQQFSYEMCEYGFYTTKGSDGERKIYDK